MQIFNQLTRSALETVAKELGAPVSEVEVWGVSGGYSLNRRSLVGYRGRVLFAKEVDPHLLATSGEIERSWLKKDNQIVEYLRHQVPEYVSTWSKLEMDGNLLLMESFSSDQGWLWSPPDEEGQRQIYIRTVIEAIKRLSRIEVPKEIVEQIGLESVFRDELIEKNGFPAILEDKNVKQLLGEKYTTLLQNNFIETSAAEQILALLENPREVEKIYTIAKGLARQPNDTFGHSDVRSDNIGYRADGDELRLVDWNWAAYNPRGMGETEFLVDMHRQGVDIEPWLEELNIEILAAFVGFFMNSSLKPAFYEGSTVRLLQAQTAAAAYQLLQTVR